MRTPIRAAFAALFLIFSGTAVAEPLKITVTPPSKERNYDRWWVLQLRCMADVVYTEARGEDDYAKSMVAHVVMRRIRENRPEWPQTPCGNVYKVKVKKNGELVSQFSGPVHKPVRVSDVDLVYQHSVQVAVRVMLRYWQPRPEHACAIAYQNKKIASQDRQGWFMTLKPIGDIGEHAFYCLPT